LTSWVSKVAWSTLSTVPASVVGVTLALARLRVTEVRAGTNAVTATILAVGEAIVSIVTSIAVVAIILWLARALTPAHFTHAILRTIDVTCTWLTTRPTKITCATLITTIPSVLWPAYALSITVTAITCAECSITGTGSASVNGILGHSAWAVEAKLALFTVDTLCVVLTVLADTATLVVAVDVDGLPVPGHLLVIVTLVRVVVALTFFALIGTRYCCRFPWFLHISRAACFTLCSTCIVTTTAEQTVFVKGVGLVTNLSVTVTHTTASNTDVLDGVVIPPSNSRILPSNSHKMSEEGLGSQQPQTYRCSPGPLLQG